MMPRPISDDDENVEYDEHNPGDDLFDDPFAETDDQDSDYIDLDDEYDQEEEEEFPLRDRAQRKRWKRPEL